MFLFLDNVPCILEQSSSYFFSEIQKSFRNYSLEPSRKSSLNSITRTSLEILSGIPSRDSIRNSCNASLNIFSGICWKISSGIFSDNIPTIYSEILPESPLKKSSRISCRYSSKNIFGYFCKGFLTKYSMDFFRNSSRTSSKDSFRKPTRGFSRNISKFSLENLSWLSAQIATCIVLDYLSSEDSFRHVSRAALKKFSKDTFRN